MMTEAEIQENREKCKPESHARKGRGAGWADPEPATSLQSWLQDATLHPVS